VCFDVDNKSPPRGRVRDVAAGRLIVLLVLSFSKKKNPSGIENENLRPKDRKLRQHM
jgi:hypothetical protein